jgi:3-methyladenine DNA glycosylase AlkD
MHSFHKLLIDKLTRSENSENAKAMKAYMRNQFDFLGIPTPERRTILKESIKSDALKDPHLLQEIVIELWNMPQREYQYCAIEILLFYKKLWTRETIKVIEFCLTAKSWWDTVDPLAYDCAGTYFKFFPDKINSITYSWNSSANLWLQRSSLLFQKSYRKDTDLVILSTYILHVASSKEFFIQKAIGWVLREYAKTNAEWVIEFVNKNKLAPLSQREALKHL